LVTFLSGTIAASAQTRGDIAGQASQATGLPAPSTVTGTLRRAPDGTISVEPPSVAPTQRPPSAAAPPAAPQPSRFPDPAIAEPSQSPVTPIAPPQVAAAAPARKAKLEVGPGKPFAMPSGAAAIAKDGDHIAIAPGEYVDCAVWRANNLLIEGTSPGVVITDKTCMGKGLFVIVGNDITVRNLTLTRARVPDNNGAGIRQEGRNLTIESVKFINNQNGILGNPQPDSTVVIRNSGFERNGTCAGACAHGIYFNDLKLLRIENSRFFETRQGHHIKSRAARTEVIDCDISDGPNGTASYLIDVSNGGSTVVRGSKLEKGPKSENHKAAIAIGVEGSERRWKSQPR